MSARTRVGRRRLLRPLPRLLATAAALLVVAGALSLPRAEVARADLLSGGGYVPLPNAASLLDTRNGTGGVSGPRGPASTTTIQVLGRAGVPADGVSAVMLRVVTVGPTAGTWLTLWPDGQPRPVTSNLNVPARGADLSNHAVVAVGANGKVAVYNNAGSVHIIVEVAGYFAAVSGAGQSHYQPIAQTRLLSQVTIGGNQSRTLTAATGPVPASATAVALAVVVSASAAGWMSVYATGGPVQSTGSFNFAAGANQSAGIFKLGTGGQVTLLNRSSQTITVYVDALGYFSPAAGAGWRTLNSRLLNTKGTVAIPANGTLDVAVGGTNGLPLRGVSGVALNLTVVDQTAWGYLKAWPSGTSEPVSSVANFPATGGPRAAFTVIQPGSDGKVRIRNFSSSSINLLVDLHGWFATATAPLPVERFSRSSAMQSSTGSLEYAYVDNNGVLQHGRQADPDIFQQVSWTPISDGERFTGQPPLAENADGRVQVTAHFGDGDVWTRTQSAKSSPTWAAWADQGGSMTSHPTVGKLPPDGRLVVFAVLDGQLWQLQQSGPNGAYTGWRSLGAADLASAVTVVTIRDGLQLFAIDTAGAVKTATYRLGAISPWTSLGGSGFNGTPAVVALPGFSMRVFVRGADGTIMTKQSDSVGTFPAAWDPVPGFTAAGSPAAVLSPRSGLIEVVARGADSHVYSTGETEQASGTWRPWADETPGVLAATDPTVLTFTRTSGSTWAWVVRSSDQQSWIVPDEQLFGASGAETRRPPAFSAKAVNPPPP
jgi:hypothetical protein